MTDNTIQADEPQGKRKREVHDEQDGNSSKRVQTKYAEMIKVIVGEEEEETPFFVHKEPLCQKSPYFEAACSREWLQSPDQAIPIQSISPDVFTLYLDWIYKGAVDIGVAPLLQRHQDEKMSTPEGENRLDEELTHCFHQGIRLYVAADILLDSILKVAVIDQVIDLVGGACLTLGVKQFHEIWDNTPPDAGLRQLVVDHIVSLAKPGTEWLKTNRDRLPHEFWVDMALRRAEKPNMHAQDFRPTSQKRCSYHDHSNEAEKAACRAASKARPARAKD